MHISPSLSRKLRETLGQDAGGDLVTWLDEQREESSQVRADMAELRQGLAAMESRIVSAIAKQIADLRVDVATQIADLRVELGSQASGLRGELGSQISGLRGELTDRIAGLEGRMAGQIADVKSDLMKWSFVFWCGAVAAIAALAGVLRGG